MEKEQEMLTLGEALPKEIERVQELIGLYEALPNGVGIFEATFTL